MRLLYSPATRLFLFLVQWTGCNLAGALGLLRILIYLAPSDGKTTTSIYERKASITNFHAVISDHVFFDIKKACNFSVEPVTNECDTALNKYFKVYEIIDVYNLYAPICDDDTTVEVERGLLRNNDLTFLLIKNEYMYTNLKQKNRKQSTQNTKNRKQS